MQDDVSAISGSILFPTDVAERFENCTLVNATAKSHIFRALDVHLGREVAIKVVSRIDDQLPNEVRVLSNLNHPGILPILDVVETKDSWCLFLPWCSEGSLESRISDPDWHGRDRVATFQKLLLAVAYVHDRGYLHRDLKPHNVLLTSRGTPRLADFGIACAIAESPSQISERMVGTPSYLAPELANQTNGPTVGSDVYSLGVLLYELLSGMRAFSDVSAIAIQEAADRGVPGLRSARSQASSKVNGLNRLSDWDAIIAKATAFAPSDRYASVHEFSEDVRRVATGQTVQARRTSIVEHFARWLRREPLLASLGFTTCLFILVTFLASLAFWTQANSQLALYRTAQHRSETIATEILVKQQQLKEMIAESARKGEETATAEEQARKLKQDTDQNNILMQEQLELFESIRQKHQETIEQLTAVQKQATTIESELTTSKEQNRRLEAIRKHAEYWNEIPAAKELILSNRSEDATNALKRTDPQMRGLEFYILDCVASSSIETTPRHPLFVRGGFLEHAIVDMPQSILAESGVGTSRRRLILLDQRDRAEFAEAAELSLDFREGILRFVSSDGSAKSVHLVYERGANLKIVTTELSNGTWISKSQQDLVGEFIGLRSLDDGRCLCLVKTRDESLRYNRANVDLWDSSQNTTVWKKEVGRFSSVRLLLDELIPNNQFIVLSDGDCRWIQVNETGKVQETKLSVSSELEYDPLSDRLQNARPTSGVSSIRLGDRWVSRTTSTGNVNANFTLDNHYGSIQLANLDKGLSSTALKMGGYIVDENINRYLGDSVRSHLAQKSQRIPEDHFKRLMEDRIQSLPTSRPSKAIEPDAKSAVVIVRLDASDPSSELPQGSIDYKCYRGGGYTGSASFPLGDTFRCREYFNGRRDREDDGKRRIVLDPGPPYQIIERDVTLVAGEICDLGTIQIQKVEADGTASITGTLNDFDGNPVSDATVTDGRREYRTGADGRYAFDNFGLEAVSLQASKPGHFGGSAKVMIRNMENRSITQDLRLFRPMRLKLKYVISDDENGSFVGPSVEQGTSEILINSTWFSLAKLKHSSQAFSVFANQANLHLSLLSGYLELFPARGPMAIKELPLVTDFDAIKNVDSFRQQQHPPLKTGTILLVRSVQPANRYCLKILIEDLSYE